MYEILLHYIWQKGLFLGLPQFTTDGHRVVVLSTGRHNTDAGPDFTDVRLLIDDVEWVGQVEIHLDSTDWYRHHHDTDPAYDHIILHVVRRADRPVFTSQGQPIPQLELQYDESVDYIQRLFRDARLMDSAWATHPCAQRLSDDPSLLTADWKNTLLQRRLTCKQASIERLLAVSHNDWNTAFYISLAHAFGFHVNGVPMELLAQATPLAVLHKHRDNLTQLTALLLGQAGLLTEEDTRYNEYLFLRTKFGLTPIDAALWKQGRMRPQTRPAVRVEQLARLIHSHEFLLSQCLEVTSLNDLRALFVVTGMGQSSVDGLLINVVAPFLFARHQPDRAVTLLASLPAEDNRIIRQWRALGQIVTSAADTQALIHLYVTCCEHGRCLSCSVWSDHV